MDGSYRRARTHVVEWDGGSSTFRSFYKPGFWLELEAADAARAAGFYDSQSEGGKIMLDGRQLVIGR